MEAIIGLSLMVVIFSAATAKAALYGPATHFIEYIIFGALYIPSVFLFGRGVISLIGVYDKLIGEVNERRAVEKRLKSLSQEHSKTAVSAEQANRSKTEFLAKMSHELRTPLNAIIGFSSMMTQRIYGEMNNPKYDEYAHLIHTSGEHLLQIINDILDLSKVESGKVELKEEVFCLSELAQDCFKFIEAEAVSKGIDFQIAAPANICVLADKRISRQMVINLLSNAIKFTPEGGTIKVLVEHREQVVFVVEDSGIGMSQDELEVALEPFGQVENVMTRSNQGTGLGLVLVKNFIELHEGKMYIATEKGQGTSVSLQFPRERSTDQDPLMNAI